MGDSLANRQADIVGEDVPHFHQATITSAVVAAKGFTASPRPNRGYVCTALLSPSQRPQSSKHKTLGDSAQSPHPEKTKTKPKTPRWAPTGEIDLIPRVDG